MQIKIRKIVRPLRLCEFDAEYGNEFISVWVNPTKRLTDQWIELVDYASALRNEIAAMISAQADAEKMRAPLGRLESISDQIVEWLVEIWSQGAEETHWNMEEVRALIAECSQNDITFYEWLIRRTSEMILAYRTEKKKA